MTTTTDTLDGTPRTHRPSARLRFFVAFLVGLVGALALGAGAIYAYDQQHAGRILPGVRIGSTNVSGMTPEAARAALTAAYHGLSEGRIVLTTPDGPKTITYAEIGRGLDTDGLIAEALVVGRNGSTVDRALAHARTAMHGATLNPRVVFDADALAKRIADIAAGLHVTAVDASVSRDDKLRFQVTDSTDGHSADPTEATQTLTQSLGEHDAPAEVTADLPVVAVEPNVTTAEATGAKAAADRITARINLTVDDKSIPILTSRLRTWITFQTTPAGDYLPVVDTTKLGTLLDGLAAKIDKAPVNASFKVTGGKITGVTASKKGYTLDVPKTAKLIETLLASRATGAATPALVPTLAVTEPALTTAEAKAAAPRMRRISSWTTYFPIWERNNFGANIWIPALTIDGYVVGPGETFDFWDVVGEVSRAKGYGLGGAIINGKTEPQGALAGGICSCSTTLFNAALRAGYQMGARRNHYYYIDRYPLGLDATVFISASGSKQTVSWTNDTDYPVLIRGYKIRDGNRGYVRFELYSVPTGRRVVIGAPVVRNVRSASDSIQYTSSLAPGATRRIESPVDGKQVWRTVSVYDRAGKLIHRVTYFSNYARITGVLLVGKAAPAE